MLFFSSLVMDFFESVETDPTGEKAWLSWGRIKNSFLISSVRSRTELDGDAGLPQAYLFQWRQ